MSELKPCPFCGDEPETFGGAYIDVRCSNRACHFTHYSMLLDYWNIRAEVINPEIAKLKDEKETAILMYKEHYIKEIAKLEELLLEAANHLDCEYDEVEDFELSKRIRMEVNEDE